MLSLGYVWIVWTLATGQIHSCEALAVCDVDAQGEGACEAVMLDCTSPPTLETCLSASAYVEDSEESDDVLGCGADGKIAVLDPWFGGEL